MGENMRVIWVNREEEYFYQQHWTGEIRLNPLNKFTVARKHG
jgi:hypothetical protein